MGRCISQVALLVVCVGLAGTSVQAQAPNATPSAGAPSSTAPRTLSDLQPNALLDAGLQIVQAIDRSEERGLWRLASTVVAGKIDADEFFKGVVQQRAGLGSPTHRQWIDLSMQQVKEGPNVPQGQYANCTFLTEFTNGRRVNELVTLHLDIDNVWRFTGYVVR